MLLELQWPGAANFASNLICRRYAAGAAFQVLRQAASARAARETGKNEKEDWF